MTDVYKYWMAHHLFMTCTHKTMPDGVKHCNCVFDDVTQRASYLFDAAVNGPGHAGSTLSWTLGYHKCQVVIAGPRAIHAIQQHRSYHVTTVATSPYTCIDTCIHTSTYIYIYTYMYICVYIVPCRCLYVHSS